MMQCRDCRKNDANMTWWEKVRYWAFRHFPFEIGDLSASKYTEGFGAGYSKGFQHAVDQKNGIVPLKESVERLQETLVEGNRLNTIVDPRHLLQFEDRNGNVTIRLAGKEVSTDYVRQLKSEADVLSRTELWKLMQETVRQMAIDDTVKKSTRWEQALAGKMMLHNLAQLQSIIDLVERTKIE